MWTKYHYFLAGLMVVTGSINTLSTKWADQTSAEGIKNNVHIFNHPFLQASGMFMGEMLCFLAFLIIHTYNKYKLNTQLEGRTINFNPFVFLLPAMCDMVGTSTMYFGLTLTSPSSFQMLRGAVIIFTGLLSVAFLGRTLHAHQWTGMIIVILGLFTVGASDFVTGSSSASDRNGAVTGDLLIITAQIIVAVQMVIEEKFVVNVPPLLAVGFEGLFGFIILSLLLIPMYYIILPARFAPNPDHRLEDVFDGFAQIGNSWQIALATIGNIASIAFFNFAGISVTKEMSATTRMVLDSVRTIVIWAVSLSLGWQSFYYLQIIGFIFLIVGMCFYYDIIIMPFLRSKGLCAQSQTQEESTTTETDTSSINYNDRDQLVA